MGLVRGTYVPSRMIRAALLKADPLMRTLGRPIAIKLSRCGPMIFNARSIDLAKRCSGCQNTHGRFRVIAQTRLGQTPKDNFVAWLYEQALSRQPTAQEREIAGEILGDDQQLTDRGIEDLLWAVVMLPEFQWVR